MSSTDAQKKLFDLIDNLRRACTYPFNFPEKPPPIANEAVQDHFLQPGGSVPARFPFGRFEDMLETVRKAGKDLETALAEEVARSLE
jgi:hypothetical protein